jgi:hypothetical protein
MCVVLHQNIGINLFFPNLYNFILCQRNYKNLLLKHSLNCVIILFVILILDKKIVEDTTRDKVEDVNGDKVKDVNGDKVEDVNGDKVVDVNGDKVEDVEREKVEDVEREKVEDVEGKNLEGLEGKKVEDIEGNEVKVVEEIQIIDDGGKKVEDEGSKIEEVGIAAESSIRALDDASSTEDEDICLVVEDETDTETQVVKTPEINTEESEKLSVKSDEEKKVDIDQPIKVGSDADEEPKISPEKASEKEVPNDNIREPSSPITSGIALDNITSNFDEDSCTSFDKSLEEIDPKKTEGENETPKDEVPAEKTPDEAMLIESEDATAKSNDEVASMEINEVEDQKVETLTGKIALIHCKKIFKYLKYIFRTNKKEVYR